MIANTRRSGPSTPATSASGLGALTSSRATRLPAAASGSAARAWVSRGLCAVWWDSTRLTYLCREDGADDAAAHDRYIHSMRRVGCGAEGRGVTMRPAAPPFANTGRVQPSKRWFERHTPHRTEDTVAAPPTPEAGTLEWQSQEESQATTSLLPCAHGVSVGTFAAFPPFIK